MSERLIKMELARLNLHLPERRVSLKEALSSEKPSVKTRSGSIHAFKRDELEFLAKLLPESGWAKLQLPILIALEPKLGRGAAKINGRAEIQVVGGILGKRSPEDELLIYRPEIAILRGKLPTTTQYMFMG